MRTARLVVLLSAIALSFSLLPALACDTLFDSGTRSVDVAVACVSGGDPAAQRAACAFGAGASAADTVACPASGGAIPIQHVVVLMQENRSFDHYLGHLPGHGQDDVDVADASITNPATAPPAVALGGVPPVPWQHATAPCLDDPDHSWTSSHVAFADGRNDGFVIASAGANDPQGNDRSGSRAMTYYDDRDLPFYYQLGSTFAIADRYFSDVLGPTFPNRLYLYAGTSFGMVSNDLDTGYHRTIFHALNERNISWKIYASDVPAANITVSFLIDSLGKVTSIDDFAEDARADRLPQVAWIDATFLTAVATATDEHAPSDIHLGQAFVHRQISALMASPSWATSVLFVTYDEAGGFYDHVPPPPACAPDGTGPNQNAQLGGFDRYGFRVPLYVVSPFARAHYVSHAVHSHSSILRFIETRFGLPALTGRDANADALLDMFDFATPPFLTPPALAAPPVDTAALDACTASYGP